MRVLACKLVDCAVVWFPRRKPTGEAACVGLPIRSDLIRSDLIQSDPLSRKRCRRSAQPIAFTASTSGGRHRGKTFAGTFR